MPVSAEIRQIFSRARLLGNGDGQITLSESEMFCLLHQTCSDLGILPVVSGLPPLNPGPSNTDYYQIPISWYQRLQLNCPPADVLLASLAACADHTRDYRLFFESLAALHKRRLKYQRILSQQPRPTMDQVGPRGLLEFGVVDDALLSSWLIWRKWIFDIDNRAAQETGYLFEPVLAGCLGGEAVGSRNSPVKRLNERGRPTPDGRQIDCYDGVNQLAYELKLRVTIAASGQGRFGEELSVAAECHAAGLTPILIVLDPTPSSRLAELTTAFTANGGRSYVGDEAWSHMESKAGATMSVFLERYIKPPLLTMSQNEETIPEVIKLTWARDSIEIQGSRSTYRFPRHG